MRALGSEIHIFPVFKVYNWMSFKRWWEVFLTEHHYDIVHGHSTNSAGIYLNVAKQRGCRTIAHIHSTGFRGNIIERLTKRVFSRMTKKQADYWFACSESAAHLLYGEDYSQESNKEIKSVYVMPDIAEFKLLATGQISLKEYISDLIKTNRFMEYDKWDKKPFWKLIKFHICSRLCI